jgi:hypothetical protein
MTVGTFQHIQTTVKPSILGIVTFVPTPPRKTKREGEKRHMNETLVIFQSTKMRTNNNNVNHYFVVLCVAQDSMIILGKKINLSPAEQLLALL